MMAWSLRLVLSVLVVGRAALGAIPEHQITSLPGYSKPLPTKQYSGYLSPVGGSATKFYHYWFVESANNPATDPVVLWLNGGPGCSSLDGYFNELGPLHFDRDSSDPQNLIDNPYSWNKIANLIFLESPVGVGYSYSTNPSADFGMTDEQTAADNYGVLAAFFKAYPEYMNNDFYVTGESYAGIYVPTLVDYISKQNSQQSGTMVNLKGFMVGNGCTGVKVGSCSMNQGMQIHMEYYHNHALISDVMYKSLLDACGDFSNISQPCRDAILAATKPIGNVNKYNLIGPCFNNLPPGSSKMSRTRNHHVMSNLLSVSKEPMYGPDECIDDQVESKYFDNETVRTAIHVASSAVTGGWRVCTDKIHYNSTVGSVLDIYPALIKQYRVIIYNGDVDGCVPYIGDEMWTSGLGLPVKEPWRSWSVDDQVAGYVTEYDVNDFKFVTVKGSGHMVPQFRPKQAYAMFEHFIKKTEF